MTERAIRRAKWEEAALKALRGEALASLITTTREHIAVEPLYTRPDPGSNTDHGPGSGTFRRGPRLASGPPHWQIRQRHDARSENANEAILADLEQGVTGITLEGASDADDLNRALAGVKLDLAPIHLAPGSTPAAGSAMRAVWKRSGYPRQSIHGCMGSDPFGHFARFGPGDATLADELAAAATTAAEISGQLPNVATFDVDATAFGDAGATDAMEIGTAIAGGVRYLKSMLEASMSIADAVSHLRFTLSVGQDQFAGIAKLRAARQCWARVVDSIAGNDQAPDRAMHIHAVTAYPMMTRHDPWVNALRCTTACFAAAVGGADAITVSPYDSALEAGSELGLRIARNTQSILAAESMLGAVTDPAGGSWYVEELTTQLGRAAWRYFQSVEGRGGLGQALLDGSVQQDVLASRQEQRARLGDGTDHILGVTIHQHTDREANLVPRPPAQPSAADDGLLSPIRWSDLVDTDGAVAT